MKATLIKRGTDNYKLYVNGVPFATTDNSPYKRLSKQNCDEIFDVVDVENYVDEYASEWEYTERISFRDGFNKAMELNKDKLFTIEDMKMAYFQGEYDSNYQGSYVDKENKYIQSLQQPQEIEVEIVMEIVPDFDSRSELDGQIFTTNKKEIPELDSQGCLILKKYGN